MNRSPLKSLVGRRGTSRRHAFSAVELLVAIFVITLLITLLVSVSSRGLEAQKRRNSLQIMSNVTLALEQFATLNPLESVYDRRDSASFGPYPAYQMYHQGGYRGSLAGAVEPGSNPKYTTLAERLAFDIARNNSAAVDIDADHHDDNRALFSYLRAYDKDGLVLIPERALKPLTPKRASAELINTHGEPVGGSAPYPDGTFDVLGIHDGWGVPLDYALYVRVAWGRVRDDTAGWIEGWKVVERRPVLRSRGITREQFDAWIDPPGRATPAEDDPAIERLLAQNEMWSEPLPQPYASFVNPVTGRLSNSPPGGGNQPTASGWARLVPLVTHRGQPEPESFTFTPLAP